MTRVFRIVTAALVSAALAACGVDETPEAATRPSATGTPMPGASPVGDASPAAPGASPTGEIGYASPDRAVAGHLATVSGVRYVGLCEQVKPDPEAVCAIRKATSDQGEVYGVGAPFSRIDGFLLLREGPTGWRVVDTYAPDGEVSAPTWMAAVR
ncbi:hypothetical protein ABT346_14835 [Micromonospora peucetia]|uniref:hypothetical protein n=1 Tax=Micromonospora peucetia TaxID=47871 RepID=UPI003327C76D